MLLSISDILLVFHVEDDILSALSSFQECEISYL